MTQSTLLEASHELVTEGQVTTLEKATNTTEAEKDTPLFGKKLQRLLGVSFNAAATKKDRNLRPLLNFVKIGIERPSKCHIDHNGIIFAIGSTSVRIVC